MADPHWASLKGGQYKTTRAFLTTRCQPTQAMALATSRPMSIWKAKNRDREDMPHKGTWTRSPSLGFPPSHHSLLPVNASTALARQTSKPFVKLSWTAMWKVLGVNNLHARGRAAVSFLEQILRAGDAGAGRKGRGQEKKGQESRGPHTPVHMPTPHSGGSRTGSCLKYRNAEAQEACSVISQHPPMPEGHLGLHSDSGQTSASLGFPVVPSCSHVDDK